MQTWTFRQMQRNKIAEIAAYLRQEPGQIARLIRSERRSKTIGYIIPGAMHDGDTPPRKSTQVTAGDLDGVYTPIHIHYVHLMEDGARQDAWIVPDSPEWRARLGI